MRNALIKWLKKIFSDIHSALIAIIVLGLISGTGIIYRFYKNLWFSIKSTILSPTPLWATIILVFVVLVYIYLKTKKTDSSSAPNYKIEYFPIENLKWKTKIYDDEHFEVERISICKEHDLPLIYENIVYYCPEFLKKNCKTMIDHNEYSSIYQRAKSYIDKEIRNKKLC